MLRIKSSRIIIITFLLLCGNKFAISQSVKEINKEIKQTEEKLKSVKPKDEALEYLKLSKLTYQLIDSITNDNELYKTLDIAFDYAQLAYNKADKEDFYILGSARKLMGNMSIDRDSLQKGLEYFIDAYSKFKQTDSINSIATVLSDIANTYHSLGEYNKAIDYCNKIDSLDKSKYSPLYFRASLYTKGMSYVYLNQFPAAVEIFTQQYLLSKQYGDTINLTRSLNALGSIQIYLGNYTQALEYLLQALKISENKKDLNQAAIRKVNIGNVLKDLQRSDEALKYYNEALKYFQIKDDSESKELSAQCLNNIGIIYQEKKKPEEAEGFYEEALRICQDLKDSTNLMMTYINLGSVYGDKSQFTSARDAYQRAFRIAKALDDTRRIALISNNIGDIYQRDKNPTEAINYYLSSLKISLELGIKDYQKLNYQGLSNSYELLGDPSKALYYYKEYSTVKDSLLNESNQRAVAQMKEQYESDKKDKENQLLKSNNQLLELQSKRDRLVKIGMGFILSLIIIFSIFVVIQLQEKKKKNKLLAEQKEEIETQRDQILEQRDMLAKQKQEITDSIYYARRIQRAVLPSDDLVNEVLPEHFILFKPRDIVSGDFFWLTKRNNKSIVVAADCTGHGVPGAFMSMLGVAFLNEIVASHKDITASEVLNQLRHFVKATLGQTGKQDEAKDGMDIALCIIDWESSSIQYSGAYNPLYFFKKGEFNEIKADKMPIGVYIKDSESFTNHVVPFEKGDTFYIFSDGYVSQFGGEDGRKFMTKPFKSLLENIQDKPMSEQEILLDEALLNWQGSYEQVDDISVIGFRF